MWINVAAIDANTHDVVSVGSKMIHECGHAFFIAHAQITAWMPAKPPRSQMTTPTGERSAGQSG